MRLKVTLTAASAVAALLLSAAAAPAQITLTNGDLLAIDYPDGPTLLKYSPTGTLLQSLVLSPGAAGIPTGVVEINGVVYVNGTNSGIGQVDLNTGVVSGVFSFDSIEASGRYGNNLIGVQAFSTAPVLTEYTTAGAVVRTVNLTVTSGSNFGLDGDGTRFFVADTDTVRIFNDSGVQTSAFNTGLTGLSGLAYDAASDQIIVSSGFGSQIVRRFTTGGATVSSFTPDRNVNGLAVIGNTAPAVAAPEPATAALLATGLLPVMGAVAWKRRRKA